LPVSRMGMTLSCGTVSYQQLAVIQCYSLRTTESKSGSCCDNMPASVCTQEELPQHSLTSNHKIIYNKAL